MRSQCAYVLSIIAGGHECPTAKHVCAASPLICMRLGTYIGTRYQLPCLFVCIQLQLHSFLPLAIVFPSSHHCS